MILDDVEIDYNQKLGSGYTAKVYKAKHKENGKEFAVKEIDLTRLDDLERKAINREVSIHKNLIH